jgi:hypothetical protein
MTRKSSFITAVGAALVLALPATALAQNERFVQAPQWQQAIMARSEALNQRYGLGDYSPAIQALNIRSKALNAQYGLGEYSNGNVEMLNARERSFAVKGQDDSTAMLDARERSFAVRDQVDSSAMLDGREEALGAKREVQLTTTSGPDAFERFVIASTRETPPIVGDDRFRLDPTTGGQPVSATNSRDIEWPQVGIGLGIGALLIIGLYLALKATRQRPLAH